MIFDERFLVSEHGVRWNRLVLFRSASSQAEGAGQHTQHAVYSRNEGDDTVAEDDQMTIPRLPTISVLKSEPRISARQFSLKSQSRSSRRTIKGDGNAPILLLKHDDTIDNVVDRAADYGRYWREDMYTDEMMEEWISCYVPNLKEIREEMKGRSAPNGGIGGVDYDDEYECDDPECGWNEWKQSQNGLLLPHQVVHCMIYHADGMSTALCWGYLLVICGFVSFCNFCSALNPLNLVHFSTCFGWTEYNKIVTRNQSLSQRQSDLLNIAKPITVEPIRCSDDCKELDFVLAACRNVDATLNMDSDVIDHVLNEHRDHRVKCR